MQLDTILKVKWRTKKPSKALEWKLIKPFILLKIFPVLVLKRVPQCKPWLQYFVLIEFRLTHTFVMLPRDIILERDLAASFFSATFSIRAYITLKQFRFEMFLRKLSWNLIEYLRCHCLLNPILRTTNVKMPLCSVHFSLRNYLSKGSSRFSDYSSDGQTN